MTLGTIFWATKEPQTNFEFGSTTAGEGDAYNLLTSAITFAMQFILRSNTIKQMQYFLYVNKWINDD